MIESEPAKAAYKRCPRCRQIYPANTNYCVRDRSTLAADDRIIAGRYVLLQKIGAGAMSEVYLADQPQLGRQVAVKLLHRDPALQKRFDIELQAVGRIRHDNVVVIHDSGRTEDGRAYLAMEYLEGEDLATHISQHGPLSGERAMILWRQAVSAIAAAHRLQIVHRDIKPANLILTHKEGDDGPEEILKVIDFSIAKLAATGIEPATSPGAVVGTMQYMAPEQLYSGQASPASDVYSLGLILVEMLTGRLPVAAASGDSQSFEAALRRLVLSPSGLRDAATQRPPSEELLQLASAVLHPDVSKRPPDAGELLRRIKRLPERTVWQKLPRKLPANKTSYSDLTWLKYSPPSEALPPGAGPPSSDSSEESSWPSEVKPWLNLQDEWGEPTVPAEARSTEERKIQALMISLSEEARRAQQAAASASSEVALPPPEDFSEPTNPSDTPLLDSEDDPTVQDKLTPDNSVQDKPVEDPIAHEPAAPLASQESPTVADTGPTAISIPKADTKRRDTTRTSLLLVALGVALLAPRWILKTNRTSSPTASAINAAQEAREAGASSHSTPAALPPIDMGRAEQPDLEVIRDLASSPDLKAPADATQQAIRVRFSFVDDDNVNQLICGEQTLFDSESSTKSKMSIEVQLVPNGTCRATSLEGDRSKTFRYEQIVEKYPEKNGVRRIHIKLRDSRGEKSDASKSDASQPAVVDLPPANQG